MIKISILDDHQGIIDGYLFRLSGDSDIQIVDTMLYGEAVEPALEKSPVDVLILDIHVPTSDDNPAPIPIFFLVKCLVERYPQMAVLIISMSMERALVRKLVDCGISGYILKDDRAAIKDLPSIVRLVANGGVYFSKPVADILKDPHVENATNSLTTRQAEALSLCAAYPEMTTHEIAERMCVADSTVRNLLSNAYLKLNVSNRAAAILKAKSLELIP